MNPQHPRHKTGRAYARLLETVGYIVALLGTISGVVTMAQVSVVAGLGYVLGAIVSGLGLVVFGEIVIVLFNIEYNTSLERGEGATLAPPSGHAHVAEEDHGRLS